MKVLIPYRLQIDGQILHGFITSGFSINDEFRKIKFQSTKLQLAIIQQKLSFIVYKPEVFESEFLIVVNPMEVISSDIGDHIIDDTQWMEWPGLDSLPPLPRSYIVVVQTKTHSRVTL